MSTSAETSGSSTRRTAARLVPFALDAAVGTMVTAFTRLPVMEALPDRPPVMARRVGALGGKEHADP
ncbi:hypothetical protein [Actinoallomurus acaciae]|uniref:Uncharacterized protein n=1 Tax=Actinoallomurus acaciae TaxID=502577 RepID=A0ABV5YBG4_9ACTN